MKTKHITYLLVTILLVGGGSYTVAQHHEHAKKHKHQRHHKKGYDSMLSNIPDLTDKQKEQIKEIHMNMTKEIIPFKNKMGEKKAKMKTLMSADKPQQEEIMNLVEEMGKLHTQMKKVKISSKLATHNILTEEQRLWLHMRKNHREPSFEIH